MVMLHEILKLTFEFFLEALEKEEKIVLYINERE